MYSHAADFESRQIERQSGEMVEAQHASRMLLKNLLPSNIVDQINQGRGLIADYFDDVTVLFTDMKGFTAFSSTITPQRLVEFLNEMYVCRRPGPTVLETVLAEQDSVDIDEASDSHCYSELLLLHPSHAHRSSSPQVLCV